MARPPPRSTRTYTRCPDTALVRSCADGSYPLAVTVERGTAPDINTVNVQNRVALAEPLLPEEVSRQGLTVRKRSSGLLQVGMLYSLNGTYDQLYLGNYAVINENGRESCRERVCQYVLISGVAGSLKKKQKNNTKQRID